MEIMTINAATSRPFGVRMSPPAELEGQMGRSLNSHKRSQAKRCRAVHEQRIRRNDSSALVDETESQAL